MTKISNSLNSIAKEIANKLDKLDGNQDGMISDESWNNVFNAKAKGGKEIKRNISVFNAEKSIKYYLNKSSSNSRKMNNKGNQWLEELNMYEKDRTKEVLDDNKKEDSVSSLDQLHPQNLSKLVQQPVSTCVAKVPEATAINDNSASENVAKSLAILNNNSQKGSIESLVRAELSKCGKKLSDEDIAYWVNRINNVSTKFDVPKEIIVSIISKENKFTKNINVPGGHGAMAITTIAINDFFPGSKCNRCEIFQDIDKNLYEDILYKKDKFGKIIKNSKGLPILKYKSIDELYKACAKDDELSMKVGVLSFKMKYAESIAKASNMSIKTAVEKLKSGKFSLSELQNKSCIASAVKNYNGNSAMIRRHGVLISVKEDYRRDVMDSLRVHGYNFAELNIIKRA